MNIKALILAGGLGNRIRSVESEKPKVMIEINNKPFVHYIIEELIKSGITSIIILCGHKYEYIINYFSKVNIPDTNIIFSIEGKLMGTAGSLLNVKNFLKDSSILLQNGDTYVNVNYEIFYKQHKELSANFSISINDVNNNLNINTDYAGIEIDGNNRLISYNEKNKGRYASCGVYLFEYEVFKHLSVIPCSIEYDLIPFLLSKNEPIYSYEIDEPFFDIGTPEGLQHFKNHIK